jgi:hypothetical protein
MAERHNILSLLLQLRLSLSSSLVSPPFPSLAKLKPHCSIILAPGGPIATPLIAHPLFPRAHFICACYSHTLNFKVASCCVNVPARLIGCSLCVSEGVLGGSELSNLVGKEERLIDVGLRWGFGSLTLSNIDSCCLPALYKSGRSLLGSCCLLSPKGLSLANCSVHGADGGSFWVAMA